MDVLLFVLGEPTREEEFLLAIGEKTRPRPLKQSWPVSFCKKIKIIKCQNKDLECIFQVVIVVVPEKYRPDYLLEMVG